MRFLRAIEADDFEALPGLVFARNFVRQYALYLKLDPGPLLALLPQVDVNSAPLPTPPARPEASVWDPRWNSAVASTVWIVLAGGAAVAAYLHFNQQSRPVVAVQQVQAAASPAKPSEPVPDAPVSNVAETAAPVPGAAPSAPAPPLPTAVPAADGHSVHVEIRAREDSWLQAIADGKGIFTGTLKAGETRSISADSSVKVRTGNAGGIDISLNGKKLDSLGPAGQIRSVTLTAEGPHFPVAATVVQSPQGETSPI